MISDGDMAKAKANLIKENRLRSERTTADHLNELKRKLSLVDEKIQRKKFLNESFMKKKFNDLSIKMEDNKDKIIRIEKINEYINEKKREEYNERARRIEIMQ